MCSPHMHRMLPSMHDMHHLYGSEKCCLGCESRMVSNATHRHSASALENFFAPMRICVEFIGRICAFAFAHGSVTDHIRISSLDGKKRNTNSSIRSCCGPDFASLQPSGDDARGKEFLSGNGQYILGQHDEIGELAPLQTPEVAVHSGGSRRPDSECLHSVET